MTQDPKEQEFVPLRDPSVVMRLARLGSFHQTRLSFMRALLRRVKRENWQYERAIWRVDASGVGPQGLGGATTSLAVHIETFPCHMASLPVAVNVNCHAARHATVDI